MESKDCIQVKVFTDVKKGEMNKLLSSIDTLYLPFLSKQKGFVRSHSLLPYGDTSDNATALYFLVHWKTHKEWKSNPVEKFKEVEKSIIECIGNTLSHLPNEDGLCEIAQYDDHQEIDMSDFLLTDYPDPTTSQYPAIEVLEHGIEVGDMKHFINCDRIWTEYLQKQDGFGWKLVFVPYSNSIETASTCFTFIRWNSMQQWKAVNEEEMEEVDRKFVETLGYTQRFKMHPNSETGFRLNVFRER